MLGVTVVLPLVGSEPLQLPDAVQLVALVEDQVRVIELPSVIELDESVRVGAAGGCSTLTVSVADDADEVPTALAQTSV